MVFEKNKIPLLFSLVYVLLFFFVKENPFFWDTIQLGSKHAHWYFENNFQYFFLPEVLDSGHPPTFGMTLAGLWTIFGKSLWVGHAMIMLFSIGIVFQLHRLGSFFLGEKNVVYLLLLAMIDPFLAGQSALVSPDIPLLFFWLLGLCAVVYNRKLVVVIAALGLAAISMRGMMMVVVIYLFDIGWKWITGASKINLLLLIKTACPYVPSGLFAMAFLWAHYQHTGWIGYHENSSWAPAFVKVGLQGFLKNVAVLGWRFLDFGRIFLFLGLGILLVQWFKNKWQPDEKGKGLLLLFAISGVVLLPSLMMHANLLAHRYLLPLVLIGHFIFIYAMFCHSEEHLIKKKLFYLAFIGMFAGNFLVYPKEISQGWDSTLAHLHYFPLRTNMMEYIDQQGIAMNTIGTDYPEKGLVRYIDLSECMDSFLTQDLKSHQYILYSNVMNDFSDEAIHELETEWSVIKEFKQMGVCVILCEKH